MNELLMRGGQHLMRLWECISLIGVTLLLIAISPLILFMMGVMILIGAVDCLLMGRRI